MTLINIKVVTHKPVPRGSSLVSLFLSIAIRWTLASVTAALVAQSPPLSGFQQNQSDWDSVEESRWARWRCVVQHWTAPFGLFNKQFHLGLKQPIKTKARICLGFSPLAGTQGMLHRTRDSFGAEKQQNPPQRPSPREWPEKTQMNTAVACGETYL